jgi:hypothetical protein
MIVLFVDIWSASANVWGIIYEEKSSLRLLIRVVIELPAEIIMPSVLLLASTCYICVFFPYKVRLLFHGYSYRAFL